MMCAHTMYVFDDGFSQKSTIVYYSVSVYIHREPAQIVKLVSLMRINLSRIPNFVICLFLAALLAFTLRDEFRLDLTFSVPISLFFVLQLQKRGFLG